MAAAEQKKIDEEIPSDLMIHILSRLPVKSLLKFKCVSKQWYNLISDPGFLGQRLTRKPIFVYIKRDQVSHCPANYCHLRFTFTDCQGKKLHEFTKEGRTYYDRSTSFSKDHIIPFVYSCNSLISFNTVNIYSPAFEHIYVCNPTTRELILLPRPHSPAFSPSITYGFGYIPSLQEYRIARMYRDIERENMNCEVLSLTFRKVWGRNRPSRWRAVSEKCPCKNFRSYEALFANGCLNWLSYDDRYGQAVVSFNLSSEKFRILLLPSGLEDLRPYNYINMVNFGGVLNLVDRRGTSWKLWVLQDQEKCIWINMHTIDMSYYLRPVPSISGIYVKGMVNDRVLIIKNQYIRNNGIKLIDSVHLYYDLEKKEFSSVQVPVAGEILDVYYSTECLASIAL